MSTVKIEAQRAALNRAKKGMEVNPSQLLLTPIELPKKPKNHHYIFRIYNEMIIVKAPNVTIAQDTAEKWAATKGWEEGPLFVKKMDNRQVVLTINI